MQHGILLLLPFLLHAASCSSVFRTGLVMDASNPVSFARFKGYAGFFKVFSETYPQGFPLGLESDGSQFRFNFSIEVNTRVVRGQETEQLVQLVEEGSTGNGTHFLFGVESDERSATVSGEFAERQRRVMMHCCADDNAFQGTRWEYFFTMMPSYNQYLATVIDTLAVENIRKIAVVYDAKSSFQLSVCRPAVMKLGQIIEMEAVYVSTQEGFVLEDAVNGIIENEAEGLIGCLDQVQVESLLNALWERKYALKMQAYTKGPDNDTFIQSLGERANGIFGVTNFHKTAKFEDDGFFGTPQDFIDLVGFDEEPDEGVAFAAASFYALLRAIQDAFSNCDITATGGDVSRLLFKRGAISCPDGRNSGYERIRLSLRFLDIPNSIVGPIEFDKFNQNFRKGFPALMTQVQSAPGANAAPLIVSPVLFASGHPDVPVRNPFVPEVCSPGYFKSANKFDPCERCPPGTSSAEEDSAACSPCLKDSYASNDRTECIPCPDNSFTAAEGSRSIRSCRCANGFYDSSRVENRTSAGSEGFSCTKCPNGGRCRGGNGLPVPLPGFWGDSDFRTEFYECDDEDMCPGGFSCGTKQDGTPKHSGRLCSNCADGFFSAMENCVECVSTGQTIGLMLALYAVWFFMNSFVSSKFDTFEMVLTWVQLANIVGSLDLDWPERIKVLFSVTSVLDFDVDAIEPTCIFPKWGYLGNFSVQLLLPVILSLLAAARYVLFYMQYRRNLSLIEKGSASSLNNQWNRLVSALGFHVPSKRADEWLQEKYDIAIQQCLSAVDLTYITITRYCFEVARCDTIAGVTVMRSSPDVECSSKEYEKLKILSICGSLFYTVGYIVFTSYMLVKLHYARMYPNRRSILRFGYLYQRFELGWAWVTILSLLVRIIFVGALVFVDDPKGSVGCMALAGIAWLLIQVYSLPYVNTTLDFLQSCLMVGLLIVTFSGLMFSSHSLGHHSRKVLEEMEVIVVIIMAIAALVITAREIIIKVKLKIIRSRHRKAVLKSLPKDVDPGIIQHDIVVSGGVEEELYDCLDPDYLYEWLKEADDEALLNFDKLSIMLRPYLSEDSFSSYLSQEIVARFWRKLVDGFPEVIDYLLVVDEPARVHFCHFTRILYRGFFLRHHAREPRFYSLINWKDRAALAQWLTLTKQEDREFFANTVIAPFKKYFVKHPSIPVPRCDEYCIEKYMKDGFHKPSKSLTKDKWIHKLQRVVSVECKSAIEELNAGRGPLAHKHKPGCVLGMTSRTELCQFARQLSQVKAARCKRGWKRVQDKVIQGTDGLKDIEAIKEEEEEEE